MAKSNASLPSTRARGGWVILLSLILVLVSVTAVFALDLTPPGSVKQYSWDPSIPGGSPKWTNGENKGYDEGNTAVMVAEITKEQGVTYDLPICLQVTESPFKGAYGFTGFEPFNTTTKTNLPPTEFPNGDPIDLTFPVPAWDTGDLIYGVYGYKITINSVTPATVGVGDTFDCNPNEVGVVVNYTPKADTGYVVWGGHIAMPGNPLPTGDYPDPNGNGLVDAGEGAMAMTGNFQARLRTAAADKTLPFVVEMPNAVELSSFGASASQALPYGLSLLGLAAAGAAGFAYRRRKQG